MTAYKCLKCEVPLDVENNRLVDARSGDDGGTYDYCPEALNAVHCVEVTA